MDYVANEGKYKGYVKVSQDTTVFVHGNDVESGDLLGAVALGTRMASKPVHDLFYGTVGFLSIFGPAILESTLAPVDVAELELRGESGSPSPPPDLGNPSPKIQGQMLKRGWTREDIQRVYETGVPSQVIDKTSGFTPATQYLDSGTGRFIVINNETGQVIQIRGSGFKPNPPIR